MRLTGYIVMNVLGFVKLLSRREPHTLSVADGTRTAAVFGNKTDELSHFDRVLDMA